MPGSLLPSRKVKKERKSCSLLFERRSHLMLSFTWQPKIILILLVIFLASNLFCHLRKKEDVAAGQSGGLENLETFRANGQSLGLASIERTHVKGLIHDGVVVNLFDESRKSFLLLRRSENMRVCKNAWTSLGEHPLSNEVTLETAIRGIREEIGADPRLMGKLSLIIPKRLLELNFVESGRIDRQRTSSFLFSVKKFKIDPSLDESKHKDSIPVWMGFDQKLIGWVNPSSKKAETLKEGAFDSNADGEELRALKEGDSDSNADGVELQVDPYETSGLWFLNIDELLEILEDPLYICNNQVYTKLLREDAIAICDLHHC